MKKLLFILTLLTYVSVSYSESNLPCEKTKPPSCKPADCRSLNKGTDWWCVKDGKCIHGSAEGTGGCPGCETYGQEPAFLCSGDGTGRCWCTS